MLHGLRPSSPLRITPHAQAPLMDQPDAIIMLWEIIRVLTSGHFNENQEDVRQLIRQAGFTNLFFFLRFIASYSGPFGKLTPHLHAEVCNFYQESVEDPGSKYAIFLGRSHYKTTIFTPGGNAWECIRDPNIQIATVSAIQDRAQEFLATTQEVFTKNEFFHWLYPEYYVEKTGGLKGWNVDQLTLPNKTRDFSKPNVRAIGALGSTQGIHVDLFKVDDPVGEDMLNAERQAGAIMRRTENWMFGSFRTLLIDPRMSRIMLAATRYGESDPFGPIARNARRVVGSPEEYEEEINPDGEWDVYWRPARSASGEIFFPENITHQFLNTLQKEDPWSYFTQYENKVRNSMTTEFIEYDVLPFTLSRDPRTHEWLIVVQEEPYSPEETIPLAKCDVVIAIDPAASEKKTHSRTSRSAVGVIAMDHKDRVFVIDLRADYVPSTTMMDWVFELYALYHETRIIVLEQQGPFKVLGPIFQKESVERRVILPIIPASATSDKTVRIRTVLQPRLFRRKYFCRERHFATIRDELMTFPDGALMDVLDMLSLGTSMLIPPRKIRTDDEEWDDEYEDDEVSLVGADPYTGY